MQIISKNLRSSVSPDGCFTVGIHRPAFNVELLRENQYIDPIGALPDGTVVSNEVNFPGESIEERGADLIYEIPNPFPFRGTTYINSAWADAKAGKPEKIEIPQPPDCSFTRMVTAWLEELKLPQPSQNQMSEGSSEHKDKGINSSHLRDFLTRLPYPLKLALAQSTTDPEDLLELIPHCCTIIYDESCRPFGLLFKEGKNGEATPDIDDHTLFELIANNPALPDLYKQVMVLKPGIQGKSEITGEWLKENKEWLKDSKELLEVDESITRDESHDTQINRSNESQTHGEREDKSHVFEYLRRNSYIPWGHFAANTADDMVRYSISDLTVADMAGMRHLYYQRTYLRLAEQLNMTTPESGKNISQESLEQLRSKILCHLKEESQIPLRFNASLWGWNFGFGYAQSGYRLHASHQQIHQQYAMIPREVPDTSGRQTLSSYACGDLVADFVESYKSSTGKEFFETYIKALRSNRRTDGRDQIGQNCKDQIGDSKILPSSLTVYEDENILLFVPKAQTSQWELQLMPLKPCGNILEADTSMRTSLDRGILMALQTLENMGARMVTSIEFSKRFDSSNRDQRILYSFMPRLPESPGAFSEAQLRWINGHYPEDFAKACRNSLNFCVKVLTSDQIDHR